MTTWVLANPNPSSFVFDKQELDEQGDQFARQKDQFQHEAEEHEHCRHDPDEKKNAEDEREKAHNERSHCCGEFHQNSVGLCENN